MKVFILPKYQPFRACFDPEQVCIICGKGGILDLAKNNENGETVVIHDKCADTTGNANVPYPVMIRTNKNIKNHTGMGNQWIPNRPTKEFFQGISGNPRKFERIDFSGHELYMTIDRAKRDGLL